MANDQQKRAEFDATALPLLDSLYTTALYLTRNPDDAADLLQDAMVRAYRFWHQFEPGTNCKAWLLTILYNVFRNRYRSKQRAPTAVEFDDALHSNPGGNEPSAELLDPAQAAELEVVDDDVRKALDDLPPSFREVVVLVDLQELTYEEAAKVIDCPVGTVRSRLSRARQALHKALWQYAKERGLVG